MCLGGSSSKADTDYKDTSEDPIISKYELTPEQKKENKRRLALKKKKSLIRDNGRNDNITLGAGTPVGGLSTPTASSGNVIT
jgi:hypothetical protein